MPLFLGVDGGQSSTTALIGDQHGRVLGRGSGGPCNHAAAGEGRARFESAMRDSFAGACRDAGLDAAAISFETACFGMSGGPEHKEEILARLFRASHLLVTHDAAVALSGATATGQGIVAIAGTGSMIFGRNAADRTARAGGWGYVFGDEGSAFDLVRHALRAILRHEEGWGPPTLLRQALLDATRAASANDVLHLFYTPDWPRARAAALATLVDQAAGEGDAVAGRILDNGAQELALQVASARGQLWGAEEAVEVAYIGGVFRSRRLLERFRVLVELEAGNRCTAPLHGPAEGALLQALRASGVVMPALNPSRQRG